MTVKTTKYYGWFTCCGCGGTFDKTAPNHQWCLDCARKYPTAQDREDRFLRCAGRERLGFPPYELLGEDRDAYFRRNNMSAACYPHLTIQRAIQADSERKRSMTN